MSLPPCLCLTWVSFQLLSLHACWGSLVEHSVFLLTDHYHQTLLTRPMKGVRAREKFATVFRSDKYRWTLLFSLLWGCFITGLSSSPVSSAPLHFNRVVCLLQFIIHSKFPLFFYVTWRHLPEKLRRPVCWSFLLMGSAAGVFPFAFPHSLPPIISAHLRGL